LPGIVHGVGFRLYGQRNFRPDRSYLTTEFFCILYLPIYPIRTMRVIPDKKNSRLPFGRSRYQLVTKHPPYFPQVFAVYQCAAAIVLLGVLFPIYVEPYIQARFSNSDGDVIGASLFFVWISIPWLVAQWLRRNAQKRLFEHRRDPNDPTPTS
jgi:hypothetical protein